MVWRVWALLWLVLAQAAALGAVVAWLRAHHHVLWLVLALAAGALGGAVCWGMVRHVALPLAKMRVGMRALAAGDSRVRLQPQESGPLPPLVAWVSDFNAVAARLQARDEAQSAFIRDISHDLRSPLTRMRLALDLARRQDATQPLQFGRIERECEQLDKLVGQLLWLARPGGWQAPTDALVDLADTVSQAVADAVFESQPKQLSILWVRPAYPVLVAGRAEELASLCENILRNAVRFSPMGGVVQVALAARRGRAVLRFADRGPGVPVAAQSKLFEPYFRVDPVQASAQAGHGLGLAIVGRVVADHGGQIRAANRRGGGLRVLIALPLAAPSPMTNGDG